MKEYFISSFVSRLGGGNLAAVVLDDKNLNEEEMQYIAWRNNLSETAFINMEESDKESLSIRYFTPMEEVDICGHAALASFYIMGKLNFLNSEELFHKTKAGDLKVIKKNDAFYIEMKSPKVVDYFSLNEVLDFTDLKEEDIIPNKKGTISIISTGLKDAIIEVKNLEVLKNLSIKKNRMIYHCNNKNIVGAHIVSRETIENDSDFAVRNFAPAVGIDEESATGTSNASLIYYLIDEEKDEIKSEPYKIEQGYFMNSPSNIYVFPMLKDTYEIYVGGRAEIFETEDIYT